MPELAIYGLKINYTDTGPKQSPLSGGSEKDGYSAPLLFIHGWCSNHKTFSRQVAYFSQFRRCIAIDLPGFGHSAKPKIPFTMTIYGEVLNGFCQRLALKEPVLIGHSLGALIGLEMSWQKPDLPGAIIMLDSAPILPQKHLRHSMQQTYDNCQKGFKKQLETLSNQFFFLPHDPQEARDAALKASQQADKDAALSIWKHMMDYDGKRALKVATAPLAYISAEKQQNNRSQLQRQQPTLKWAQVMDGGHMAHMTQPEQVNAMIASFLAVYQNQP